MQTRSSSKFVGEPSTNPTSMNPKRRNRRHSKQRVEPFAFEEVPVVTMADQRTMAELLRAPTEGYAEAIVVPPIPAEHLELKHSLINLLEETFSEAWDRFKDLLRACPHHGFTELHQLATFYNGLNPSDQDSLNSAAGGNLLERKIASAIASVVTSSMTAMFKQHQVTPALASIKAVEWNLANCCCDFDTDGDLTLLKKLLIDDPSSPLPPKELHCEELKMIKYSIDDHSGRSMRQGFKTAGDHRKVQMNELNELRDQAYENSLIYKEKTKKIHDSKIKNRVFNVEIPSGESKVHIEVLSVLWGNRLPIPDGSLPLFRYQIFTKGQKQSQTGQNRERNWKERKKTKPKHAQSEDVQELLNKLVDDVRNINEELAEYTNTPSWNLPNSSYDDDDDEESSIPLKDIIMSGLPPCVAITADSSKTDSLIMVDKHLDTISETESDEFIKSSVENLVQNPSESEDASNGECDLSVCDDFRKSHLVTFSNPLFDIDDDYTSSDDESFSEEDVPMENFKIFSNPLFDLDEEIISTEVNLIQNEVLESITSISPGIDSLDAESNLIESLLNRNTSIDSSSKIDSLLNEFAGELTLLKSIPSGIDDDNLDPEGEIHLVERLLYDNLYPRPLEDSNSDVSDAMTESFSPSPIPVEDSDSLMEEID
ncbi:hypothetical protein Tco_0861296, partial [Tanacetum coccineum]